MFCFDERGLWAQAFRELARDGLGDGPSRALGPLASHVLIFVACGSADSVAALRILERLLAADGVPYAVHPVAGPGDLQRAAARCGLGGAAVRSVVLINCGATEDVARLLGLGPNARAFVFDAHRPMHLNNADSANRQVLMVARRGHEERAEAAAAAGVLHTGSSDEESGFSSSSESSDSEEEADGDGDAEEEGGAGRAARRRERNRRPEFRAAQRERRRQIAEYYDGGGWYGEGAGSVLFDFAREASPRVRADPHVLWCGIVALTDAYVHRRESHEAYVERVNRYERLVLEVAGQAPAGTHEARDATSGAQAAVTVGGRRICAQQDSHLPLLRHWTLLESLTNSPYVAIRMGTWKERGRDNVRRLLARMGLPLRDCQQPWKQMSPRQKRDLSSKLEEFAPQFRLAELRYPSFQLEDGYRVCMGAADHVHAVTALLEVGQGAADADLDAEERFWLAYRALGPAKGAGGDGNDLLLTGLGRGRQLHQAVVQVGGSHIQAGTIMRASRFRYLNLADSGNALDSELMAHVLALQRLSLFLQEAYEHMGKAAIPVVVVGPKSEAGYCLVVAATGSSKGGQLLNRLSVMFRKAADEIGAQVRQSSFDSSAIEILAKDVPRFLDELILDET